MESSIAGLEGGMLVGAYLYDRVVIEKIGLREVRNIKNQYNSFLANEGGDKK